MSRVGCLAAVDRDTQRRLMHSFHSHGKSGGRRRPTAQVKTVAHALKDLDEKSFRSKFAPEAMSEAGVYPTELWVSCTEGVLSYMVQHHRRLVQFYQVAAARGDGVIQWLS